MSDEVFIRPDVKAYLEKLKAQPRPKFTLEVLKMLRSLPPEMMAMGDMPVGDLAVDQEVTMPGPAGPLALRMFDPRTERPVGPVVVFFHGGGFCVGSITSHAALAAEISRQLDLPVISVEYRLAPEHPWPAAPDDAEAAARWIAENGDVFGRTFDGLILCGDSAGGNLALVTALAFREAPANAPLVQQLTLYPGTDTGSDRESRQKFSQNYGLDGEDMTLFEQHYAGDSADWRHSPLKADLTGLAPTVLITAALDPLRDEGRAFAAKLTQSGCDVVFREIQGVIHGFATFRKDIPSVRQDLTDILDLSRTLLNTQSV